MRKYLLRRKRGQVGITITWFVAFIVIFFIILLFIGIVAMVAAQKGVGKNDISVVETGFNKIENQRELMNFLNNNVEIDGKKINVKDEILILLEPYLGGELMKEINLKDINNLNLYRSVINPETLLVYKIDKTKENSAIEILRKDFDNSCMEYILKFSFGYFYRYGDKNFFIDDIRSAGISAEFDKALGDYSIIKLPYKNQKIEIKLKSRYVC